MSIIHAILVHFPIALFVTGWLVATIYKVSGRDPRNITTGWCLLFGNIIGTLAAIVGWMTAFSVYGGLILFELQMHAVLGTLIPLLGWVTLYLFIKNSKYWYWLLTVLVAVVGAAGHFGGYLVHGEFKLW